MLAPSSASSPDERGGGGGGGRGDGDHLDTVLDRLVFRTVSPTDVSRCYEIERSSYPPNTGATKSNLQYRQHHAAMFFRCAVLLPPEVLIPPSAAGPRGAGGGGIGGGSKVEGGTKGGSSLATESLKMTGTVIGFVCSTRCWAFDRESMSVHDPTGPLLAVHSVVVSERYRNIGVGGKMLREYVSAVRRMELKTPLEKVVLAAKAAELAFYVRAGFRITRPSPIKHGEEAWYEGELEVRRRRGGTGGGEGGLSGGRKKDGADEDDDEEEDDGSRPCWIVDSFAVPGKAGGGNPAGVVLLSEDTEEDKPELVEWMRTVAKEFSQSETAFVWEKAAFSADGGGGSGGMSGNTSGAGSSISGGIGAEPSDSDDAHYRIKYFTCSGAEVDLCGHATLASASVLFELLGSSAGGKKKRRAVRNIVFHANCDELKAKLAPDESTGVQIHPGDGRADSGKKNTKEKAAVRIAMDFPWRSVREVNEAAGRTAVLEMVQGAFTLGVGFENDVLFVGIDSVGEDVVVELTRERLLTLGYGPAYVNYDALNTWGGGYTRGVILCCRATEEDNVISPATGDVSRIDFLSRFFGPKAGIPEDAVTGSAHCTLAPYFGAKVGRTHVVGKQISERGGVVECKLEDGVGEKEEQPKRVWIVGTAMLAVGGTLYV